jgi:VWFA-related protein
MKNSSLTTFKAVLSGALLCVIGTSIQAQQSDHPRNSVTIDTDLVVTWAQILDRKDGNAVNGLEIGDFLLKEEAKAQQISLVKEGQPVSVVILLKVLVPCGGDAFKLAPEWSFHRAGDALRQLGDDAEIALMAWDNVVTLVQPLTRDNKLIVEHLEDRNGLRNATPPNPSLLSRPGDAIYQAAQYLEKAASPERRKIIIVIDADFGIDKQRSHTAADVKDLLDKTGTTVYGLYLWPDVRAIRKGQQVNRKQGGGVALEEFVEQTGGSILIGRLEESDGLLIKLAGLIRSSYTIGYYPENSDFDGRFRRISLELSSQGKAKVGKVSIKARTGYRALRPSSPAASASPPQQ